MEEKIKTEDILNEKKQERDALRKNLEETQEQHSQMRDSLKSLENKFERVSAVLAYVDDEIKRLGGGEEKEESFDSEDSDE